MYICEGGRQGREETGQGEDGGGGGEAIWAGVMEHWEMRGEIGEGWEKVG